jgi:molybdopterin-guanine dinucleotide biosynthesis protein A
VTGAVLAGGRGSRMGASKPLAPLRGRPMIDFPLAALSACCERVAVVCKADTELPGLPEGVERWEEPEAPRHPAAGIAHALDRAGEEVLVCPTDMPLVRAGQLDELLAEAEGWPGFPAVVALMAGRAVPVLGVYRLEARAALMRAAQEGHSLQEVARELRAATAEVEPSLSVDSPEDLARAEALLSA